MREFVKKYNVVVDEDTWILIDLIQDYYSYEDNNGNIISGRSMEENDLIFQALMEFGKKHIKNVDIEKKWRPYSFVGSMIIGLENSGYDMIRRNDYKF